MSTAVPRVREEGGQARPAVGATVLPPLRSRWLLATALVLVALATFVLWAVLARVATDATADSFLRTEVPGELTTDLRPGTWNVYAEGPVTVQEVTVTRDDGRPVKVTEHSPTGAGYDRGGSQADVVAEFDIPLGGMSGELTIAVSGTTERGAEGAFAVGAADEFDFLGIQRWAMVALLAVNLTAAVLIGVVPFVRRRRHAPD